MRLTSGRLNRLPRPRKEWVASAPDALSGKCVLSGEIWLCGCLERGCHWQRAGRARDISEVARLLSAQPGIRIGSAVIKRMQLPPDCRRSQCKPHSSHTATILHSAVQELIEVKRRCCTRCQRPPRLLMASCPLAARMKKCSYGGPSTASRSRSHTSNSCGVQRVKSPTSVLS